MRTRVKTGESEMDRLLSMLGRYRRVDEEVACLKDELRVYKEQEENVAQSFMVRPMDGMPRAKGGIADPTLQAVEMIVGQCQVRARNVLKKIRALLVEREELDELFMRLGADEQAVIRMRWIQRKSWVSISIAMHRCERQCQRIQRSALDKMVRAMQEGEPDDAA